MKNKYIIAAVLAVIIVMSVAFLPSVLAGKGGNGNGAPNGQHYTLNLIGKDKVDILPNDKQGGNRIFVNLNAKFGTAKQNKIYLTEGNDFDVIDPDATDGRAEFMLPAPFDGESRSYLIYIRELGKPGGEGRLTTCYTEGEDDYCLFGVMDVPLERKSGKPQFKEVTKELTTLCYLEDPTDPDSVVCENIFTDGLKDYYWNYDNAGLRLVQLRFYPL